ncbi:MAG: hypothetical protein MJZ54_06110 [Bacteroidaceae bacterium]|nr:hypothetical protein [Bacteroidaceae bacterium]
MPTKNTNFGTAGDYYPFLFIGVFKIRVSPGPPRTLCRRGMREFVPAALEKTRIFRTFAPAHSVRHAFFALLRGLQRRKAASKQ